jgi:hypothetical protein
MQFNPAAADEIAAAAGIFRTPIIGAIRFMKARHFAPERGSHVEALRRIPFGLISREYPAPYRQGWRSPSFPFIPPG